MVCDIEHQGDISGFDETVGDENDDQKKILDGQDLSFAEAYDPFADIGAEEKVDSVVQ